MGYALSIPTTLTPNRSCAVPLFETLQRPGCRTSSIKAPKLQDATWLFSCIALNAEILLKSLDLGSESRSISSSPDVSLCKYVLYIHSIFYLNSCHLHGYVGHIFTWHETYKSIDILVADTWISVLFVLVGYSTKIVLCTRSTPS